MFRTTRAHTHWNTIEVTETGTAHGHAPVAGAVARIVVETIAVRGAHQSVGSVGTITAVRVLGHHFVFCVMDTHCVKVTQSCKGVTD